MSSIQQPGRKRPRFDSNNNVNSQNNNCNTSNINLLSLPDEALNNIISYSIPREECQVWEWIGMLSHTCRSIREIAHSYAPTRIVLKDFEHYLPICGSGRRFDARIRFLRFLCDFSWKREHLKEFHVNDEAVLRDDEREWGAARFVDRECNDIKTLLRTLITTPSSFPELEWLDIELQSDDISDDYGLVDAESLQLIPDAFPALRKLCLCQCFKKGMREISPYQLRQFCSNLQTPLTSLSLCGAEWMTDAHVEVMMPVVGENLVRLELVDCMLWEEEERLSDNSLFPIARQCKQLKSFSMVGSDITTSGLEMVLSVNTGITTLNLSSNRRLDPRAMNVISRYLPRLEVLRNYWSQEDDWLNDDGLISLVDAQEKESGGSGIFLNLIGLLNLLDDPPQLTTRGLKYAIEKGLREIEIAGGDLHKSIKELGSDVKLYQANYTHYIDGSKYERNPVQLSHL